MYSPKNHSIRIGLAEDHTILRQALFAVFDEVPDITLQIHASNGLELMRQLQSTTIDVLLLDIEMPYLNGLKVLQIIRTKYPKIKPLIVSSSTDYTTIQEARQLGARGYLSKSVSLDTMVDAIRDVHRLGFYANDLLFTGTINSLPTKRFLMDAVGQENLSSRETDVLTLVCKGHSNDEIADKLYISVRTVENHRRSLLSKTRCRNVVELVNYAITRGYVELEILNSCKTTG